ncbi:ATP-binding protein [Mucilaginibacter sp.]|uniref:ATP-binding protein n=1 Tax=Mucilaginibacter sp. TaxID=1882438 RepID=UPI003262DB26
MDISNIPFPILTFADEVNKTILEESGICGVCTDEDLKVLRSFGAIAKYLKKEIFNSNLNDLLPDDVSLTVKAAAYKALKSNQRILLGGLKFEDDNGIAEHKVDVVIRPFLKQQTTNKFLLILFSDGKSKSAKVVPITKAAIAKLSKAHLSALELELNDAKQELEIALEQIASTNENMQSFNEELLSANEEMQSANEELQSVNEESQTINKEQQITNSELTELNDDLNNYFRSNINGQLFVDHELLLKKYSPSAAKLINIRESDIGRPLNNITTNIKVETLIADIKMVIGSSQTITREAESSDGKIYQVMTMPYVRKDKKRADGAVISFYDITELKKLLQALDISNKNLQESVRALEDGKEQVNQSLKKERELNHLKSRFVSMASHEFRTPLSSIQLSAILIEKYAQPYQNPNIDKHIAKIRATLGNVNGILNDFLSLERLESGKIDCVLDFLDIIPFAEEITEQMQMTAKQNQQIVYSHKGEVTTAQLDKALLKNCIINLISNAVKYSGENTTIRFHTESTLERLVITVTDNGIGIPLEDQQHLFEAFFRAHNTGNIPGTGLGLNIVTRYVGLMNGAISFESKVGQGTAFTISLPIVN